MLEALKRYDSPTLSNAIETFGVRPRDVGFASHDVRCMFPDLDVMVGFAATATIRARGKAAGDPGPLWTHVREVPAPRVVVVQDLDEPPAHGALWGEVMATTFTALGCVGAVTDGCVRDLDEVRAIGFHFFARGPGVSHAYVRVDSVGEPVTVGGLTVSPGDLIHADQHGVLLIPRDIAAELPAAAAGWSPPSRSSPAGSAPRTSTRTSSRKCAPDTEPSGRMKASWDKPSGKMAAATRAAGGETDACPLP